MQFCCPPSWPSPDCGLNTEPESQNNLSVPNRLIENKGLGAKSKFNWTFLGSMQALQMQHPKLCWEQHGPSWVDWINLGSMTLSLGYTTHSMLNHAEVCHGIQPMGTIYQKKRQRQMKRKLQQQREMKKIRIP